MERAICVDLNTKRNTATHKVNHHIVYLTLNQRSLHFQHFNSANPTCSYIPRLKHVTSQPLPRDPVALVSVTVKVHVMHIPPQSAKNCGLCISNCQFIRKKVSSLHAKIT